LRKLACWDESLLALQ